MKKEKREREKKRERKKENYPDNYKASHRVGKYIYNRYNQQRVYIQNT